MRMPCVNRTRSYSPTPQLHALSRSTATSRPAPVKACLCTRYPHRRRLSRCPIFRKKRFDRRHSPNEVSLSSGRISLVAEPALIRRSRHPPLRSRRRCPSPKKISPNSRPGVSWSIDRIDQDPPYRLRRQQTRTLMLAATSIDRIGCRWPWPVFIMTSSRSWTLACLEIDCISRPIISYHHAFLVRFDRRVQSLQRLHFQATCPVYRVEESQDLLT